MTLDDLECQHRGFCGIFFRYLAAQVYIIHKAAPRFWRWWRGVVGNAFWLKRSYSTPGPVNTAMGDYWTGTAIGFRASREHSLKFLVLYVSWKRWVTVCFWQLVSETGNLVSLVLRRRLRVRLTIRLRLFLATSGKGWCVCVFCREVIFCRASRSVCVFFVDHVLNKTVKFFFSFDVFHLIHVDIFYYAVVV